MMQNSSCFLQGFFVYCSQYNYLYAHCAERPFSDGRQQEERTRQAVPHRLLRMKEEDYMGKRILSFLLAFVMVVGMIPASAFGVFAAEPEPLENVVAHLASGSPTAQGTPTGIPTVDGTLTDHIWVRAIALNANSTVTGTVAAAWAKGIL